MHGPVFLPQNAGAGCGWETASPFCDFFTCLQSDNMRYCIKIICYRGCEMKNLKYQLPAMIAVILVFAFFMRSRTIEEYVLDRYESATEILYHDRDAEDHEVVLRRKYVLDRYESATEILYHDRDAEDHEVVFFLEDDGGISCAVLKKKWSGYQILRTSGKLSLHAPGYLCSFFQDGEDRLWIDWGIITDDAIKGVWTESGEMNLAKCDLYSYRICWLTGRGQEPQDHLEKK